MERMQYTVRGIPASLDAALREQARATNSSLNTVVIRTLTRAALPGTVEHDDLDWFIGSAPPASSEESAAMEWLDALPRDLG